MLPSNPDVTSSSLLLAYSMFLTHSEWPRRVLILVLRYLASHRHTVVSSEQVANVRESRNLWQAASNDYDGLMLHTITVFN